MNLHDISYYANLIIFIPTPLIYLVLFYKTLMFRNIPWRKLWFFTSISGFFAPFLFLAAQLIWVKEEHHSLIDKMAVTLWLGFDYWNAAHYLASGLLSLYCFELISRTLKAIERSGKKSCI